RLGSRVGPACRQDGSSPRRPRLNEPLRDLHPSCRRAAVARTPWEGFFHTPSWTKAASRNVRYVLVAPPRIASQRRYASDRTSGLLCPGTALANNSSGCPRVSGLLR